MQFLFNISGLLIFFSFLTTLYAYFFNEKLLIIAGVFAWISFLILFPSIKNKKIIIVLLILSFLAFFISYLNDFKIDLTKVFTVNQYLLTLLIAVGFLRLIANPKKEKTSQLPKGKKSFIKTYLSVHLFGSVINISSLILVADKMYKKAPLSNAQVVLLTRAFASDAYWSPFFVAFAAAITYAPKLDTSIILLNGIVLSILAFLITYYEVLNNKEFNINEFRGYPLSFESLYLPFVLALLVLITNYFFPNIKVIVLISTYSLLMSLLILPVKKGLIQSYFKFAFYISDELPKMKTEMALFLVAGMFGIFISSILIGMNLELPFEIFDWQIASILLLIFIILAFVGIHPIITIAIIGDFLSGVNHTLLALTFLMAWSTTVSTSPFSGLNLTVVARYDFAAKEIFRLNIFYAFKMYLICVFCLFILSNYLGL
ncbi:tellurium resistance protein TerC [Arcobacter suis]|uniref:Membrane protein n=1 Tax=Arcobacter suis CECT 7833 TaxID=663365 RepID=A0AAD0WRI2_9BACT|nr:tellurium resistance protein TerC [Arcobacter suis]AXX90781.1 putative membrane protein [Arcobacter suis CECT 7833]RWS45638.1 tellurium resistance protein TerC [Arcobacter suis]